MSKATKVFLVSVALAILYALVGGYPSKQLKGSIKAVTVTETSFVPGTTNSVSGIQQKSVRIEDPQSLAAIENSLDWVWISFTLNSMDGFPKYRMQVEYSDGKTETFVFTRTEWGNGGSTPRPLLHELEKHGL